MNIKYNRWLILIVSALINVCMGSGYAWSVYTEPLSKMFGWSSTELALAFTINMGIAPIPMIIGAKIIQKKGARFNIIFGSLIMCFGYIATGFIRSLPILYLTYGVIAGFGFNLAYSAVLNNTVKFFPDKSGLALGVVLAGFSSGGTLIAPVATFLIQNIGVLNTFKFVGIGLFTVVFLCSFIIKNAPADYKPAGWEKKLQAAFNGKKNLQNNENWKQMVSHPKFYLIALLFATGAFTGLMVISSASPIGQGMFHLTPSIAALFVSIVTICNGFGRFTGGAMTDRFGAVNVMKVIYILTIVSLVMIATLRSPVAFAISMVGIGLCYGGSIASMTALVNINYGTKHFTTNYGIAFIAFSITTYCAPRIAASIKMANHGDYTKAFYIGIVVALAGFCASLVYSWQEKRSEKLSFLRLKNTI